MEINTPLQFDSGKLIGVNKVDASGDFVSNVALILQYFKQMQ